MPSIARRTYQPGTVAVGPFPIPAGPSLLILRLERVNWPDTGADVVSFQVELSLDDGQTWQFWVGFTARGGDLQRRDGTIAPESVVRIPLPNAALSTRQLRGTIVVAATLRTTITAEWT